MHKIAKPLASLSVPIQTLNVDPANARKHSKANIEAVKASLDRFGQRVPVVVQKNGMIVRAGNARLLAALDLGWTHLAAMVVNETDIEAAAYAIADNRTAELAEWDDEALVRTLAELKKIDPVLAEISGFSMDEISRMLDKAGGLSSEDDELPPIPP